MTALDIALEYLRRCETIRAFRRREPSTLECVRMIRADPSARRIIELSVDPEQMREIDRGVKQEALKS